MYNARDIAALVVDVCAGDGCPITNLKLQKVLYFMWLDWFRERGERLFNDKIEAWHYGPTIPDVYQRYRTWIADPIRFGEGEGIPEADARKLEDLARKYNRYSVGTLIDKSKEEGSPWALVGGDRIPGTEIGKGLMILEAGRIQCALAIETH